MKRKFRELKNEPNKKYKLGLFLCWVSSIVLFTGAAFTTSSFIGAVQTPDQVLQEGYSPLPPGWEAGVFQHGDFYRWITIKKHPILFGISIVAWIISVFLWIYYTRKLKPYT